MAAVLEGRAGRMAEEGLAPMIVPAGPAKPWGKFARLWGKYIAAAVVGAIAIAAVTVVGPRLLSGGPPPDSVTASGRIEGREITLAPKDIQARVSRLMVDEGQTVKKGDLLAELDSAQLDARYASASAAIATLDAQIAQATLDVALTIKNTNASTAAAAAAVSGARAHVVRASAVRANAAADRERAVRLFEGGAISKRERDQAEMSLQTSDADVDAAEKDLARAQADLALAQASKDGVSLKRQQVRALQENRRAAVGQLAEAEAYSAERRIVAPTDGTILSRPVEVGDVVSPGSPVFQMVDLARLYVKVYIPEPDVAKLRLGQDAEVTVDAFPDRRFPARISKIHDQAEFTPKNVETTEERLKLVFGVELSFINPDSLLKPGMPADCIIHWQSAGPGVSAHGP